MLAELDRIAADPASHADRDDVRALAELCRYVASECARLNLDAAERNASSLAAELSRSLLRHCH